MSQNNRWLAIVNLLSGSGKCGRDWDSIAQMLYSRGIEFDTVFTGFRFHAIELARKGIEEDGYRNLIAVGGDGTIHEVANGILTQSAVDSTKVRMGVIAVGTGNDWIRSYGIPTDYKEAVDVIVGGKSFTQDVAKATYINRSGESESRYCVNIAGTGLDAAVNLEVCKMKDKGKNGKMAYMMQLAKSVLSYRSRKMSIKIDGEVVREGLIMSTSMGIGQYNGSGMRQLPLSKADDGLLDCTIIERMSIPKIAMVVGKLYDGKIYSVRKIHHHTGRLIEVASEDVREVEIDGEPLGTTPVRYEIEDKRLTIIVP